MDPTKINKYLNQLDSLERLRELLRELKYEYEDQLISDREWEKETASKIGQIKKVGNYADFSIIYCRCNYEKDNQDTRVDKKMASLERKIYKKLPEKLKPCMMVFTTKDEKHWHFINPKPQKSRVLLRRYIIGPGEKIRTASERLAKIEVTEGEKTYDLQEKHELAFNVKKVTEEFFQEYKKNLNSIIHKLKSGTEEKKLPILKDYTQQLLSRLMFLYFLQRKGWLGNDIYFMRSYWENYQSNQNATNFYEDYLKPLFFIALNKPTNKKHVFKKDFPEKFKKELMDAPYLDGGLFRENELDDLNLTLSDEIFEQLFGDRQDPGLLEHYNFTIREDAPFDREIAVDPEMLGLVYESLVHEEERGKSGIFYTPRTEVDFMCRRALLQYLLKHSREVENKKKLYQFLFEEKGEEVEVKFSSGEQKEIINLLRNVTVLDPAVGSGSFLIGMMQVLMELFGKLYRAKGLEKNTFALKEQIIEEVLYGVDIKKWAVQVAKLRLWLQLVIDAGDELLDSLYQEPLLPSLSFKLRVGDSLVQKIGGIPFGVHGEGIEITGGLKKKLTELKRDKREFYQSTKEITRYELKRREREFHEALLQKKISKLEQKRKKIDNIPRGKLKEQAEFIKNAKQEELELEEDANKLDQKRENISTRIQKLQKQKRKLTKEREFIWRIGFPEIFYKKDGFDIVIANPPYVRQEKIEKDYKNELLEATQLDWGDNLKIQKRTDLYVYFYFKGLALLNPKGTFCYVSSSSWLDVGYGKELQEFLLTNTNIVGIYDNQVKRTFKSADVNTIIVVLTPSKTRKESLGNKARFVMFKKPFEEVINSDNLWEIDQKKEKDYKEYFKVFPITQAEIYKRGASDVRNKEKQEQFLIEDIDKLDYNGDKWGGKYLRAPEIYWKILEKAGDKLVRLGDIAEVRFGIKTGANDFFYVEDVTDKINFSEIKDKVQNLGDYETLEKIKGDDLRIVKNKKTGDYWLIEKKFLEPIIKSLKELPSIQGEPRTEFKVVVCHKSKGELSGTKIVNYIAYGEKRGYHSRPTCKSRDIWYSLGEMKPGDFIFSMTYGSRYLVPENRDFLVDATIYNVYLKKGYKDHRNFIRLFLNSSLSPLLIEIFSRVMTGALPLAQLKVYEWKMTNIVVLPGSYPEGLSIYRREVKSIFEELGFNPSKIIHEQEPNPLPDRKVLDDIVFDALGLTQQERKEVYWAVAELVKNRLEKAKSI